LIPCGDDLFVAMLGNWQSRITIFTRSTIGRARTINGPRYCIFSLRTSTFHVLLIFLSGYVRVLEQNPRKRTEGVEMGNAFAPETRGTRARRAKTPRIT
jgi:hypothetical protein